MPNNETYDIKDKNAVKNITNSDIPGNINFTKGEETKDILVKDFGTAYGIDCYKGKLPLDFTSPSGAIDEWKIYGNSSGPAEVLETQSTLPISIDTYGGNAVDWEIYGNNNPVVENKTGDLPIEVSATAGNAVDWTIYGNDDVGENLAENVEQGSWSVTGFAKSDSKTRCRIGNIIDVVGSQQYTMYLECPSHNGLLNIQFKNDTGTSKGETGWQSVGESGSYTATIPSDATKITIILAIDAGAGNCTPDNFTKVMFVKGSTAPDHYIPYQKGVGERTANLFDFQQFAGGTQTTTIGGLTFTRDNDTVIVNNSSKAGYPLVFLNDESGLTVPQLTQGQTYSGKIFISNAPSGSNIYVDVMGKNQGGVWTWIKDITASGNSFKLSTAYDIYGYRLVCKGREISYENTRVKFVLTKGSTAPSSYIPYGYEIPLTVSQTGQTDKNYDIYIGDSPLTEGETVSKSLAGVDIELFNGNNIIDTSLYNKPNTSITYNSSVLGVGENTEITEELPIDFRSNGDDLLGYRIYGTADGSGVQTENVADISASALIQVNAQGAMRYGVIVPDIPAGEWTISMNTPVRYPYYLVKRVGSVYTNIGNTSGLFVPQTITLDEQCDLIIRTASPIEITWEDYFGVNLVNMMVTKGSIPPSIYIPYGYKLPLTVTNGTETKTTDIYIGDSKLGEAEYVDYGEQKIYKRILFMTHDGKHFITKDNKDFCLRRRGYNG